MADLHAEQRLPPRVTGDEVYGADPKLRAWLENPQVGAGYVLGIAIARSAPIAFTPIAFTPIAFTPIAFTPIAFTPIAFTPIAFTPIAFTPIAFTPIAFTPIAFSPTAKGRADDVLKTLMASDYWVIDSCGVGSKGERRYAGAWIGTADARRYLLTCPEPDSRCQKRPRGGVLPVLRPPGTAAGDAADTCADRRSQVADRGGLPDRKAAFGLDHSQVRTYPTLLRYLVLALAALAVCAIAAAQAAPPFAAALPPAPHRRLRPRHRWHDWHPPVPAMIHPLPQACSRWRSTT
ncbi:hypothetical protein ABZ806_08870 [Spirillospora sp. NPDC047418]